MKVKIKKILGWLIILNLLPVWCLCVAAFTDNIPPIVNSEMMSGYIVGWIGNGIVTTVGALLFLAKLLIDNE